MYYTNFIHALKPSKTSDASFHLAVGGQWFPKVVPHSQAKLLGGMLLLDLGLQLETLFCVKAVERREGKRLLSQKALQPCAPGLEHRDTGLRGNMSWSPEDLWGQDLESTVVQDTVLEVEITRVGLNKDNTVKLKTCRNSTCSGHKVTFMSPLMPFALNMDSWDPVVKDSMAFLSYTGKLLKYKSAGNGHTFLLPSP